MWKGEGDHAMRVWTDGCGTGGRGRSGDYGHGVVRSVDCAFSPRRDTAFQPMRQLLNWQLKHGSRMNQPNSQTVSSHRTHCLSYVLMFLNPNSAYRVIYSWPNCNLRTNVARCAYWPPNPRYQLLHTAVSFLKSKLADQDTRWGFHPSSSSAHTYHFCSSLVFSVRGETE